MPDTVRHAARLGCRLSACMYIQTPTTTQPHPQTQRTQAMPQPPTQPQPLLHSHERTKQISLARLAGLQLQHRMLRLSTAALMSKTLVTAPQEYVNILLPDFQQLVNTSQLVKRAGQKTSFQVCCQLKNLLMLAQGCWYQQGSNLPQEFSSGASSHVPT